MTCQWELYEEQFARCMVYEWIVVGLVLAYLGICAMLTWWSPRGTK